MTQQPAATPAAQLAIIGGGIGGLTLAYRLAQAGQRVTLYEQADHPGGLATCLSYNGAQLDRFYHTILSSDMAMQTLITETGVADRLHFRETKQGFYHDGRLYPFNTPLDFLLFPPLNVFQRFRLGLQIITAQFERDADRLDRLPVERWLLRVSGRGVYERVWQPLLRAKFDSETGDVPATYIWARLKRMMATRQGVTSREMMCYLEGGYYTLIEALAAACTDLGVTLRLNTAVEALPMDGGGRITGVQTADGFTAHDAVISTLQSPLLARLLPDAPEDFRAQLAEQRYLGVLCPLLILKKPLTPYYVLNITDGSIPFTAVVETTALIDPAHVGGRHLVYLPKYLAPDSPLHGWDDAQVEAEWMGHFRRMFPGYDPANIEAFLVQRARYVEPLRPIGTTDAIPPQRTPVPGLYISNSVQVYPALNNGESITTQAGQVVERVLADLTS